MSFKVGDRVKIVRGCPCGCIYLHSAFGREGVITKIGHYEDYNPADLEVTFPYPVPGMGRTAYLIDATPLELVFDNQYKPEDCF